jgi:hypothetical protein
MNFPYKENAIGGPLSNEDREVLGGVNNLPRLLTGLTLKLEPRLV